MTTIYSVHRDHREDTPECRHCYGGGWVADQVETTFGEFEDVFYVCSMCRGTGKAMSKDERGAR